MDPNQDQEQPLDLRNTEEVSAPPPQGETSAQTQDVPPELAPKTEKTSSGAIFGAIIIVIVLVLAGFYFWGSMLKDSSTDVLRSDVTIENAEEVGAETETMESEMVIEGETGGDIGEPLSSSDEVEDIETDLEATELDNLDAELNDIDLELEP